MESNKYEAQKGVWTLMAPNGDTWRASTPLSCCRKERDDRVPADVQIERITKFLDEDDWTEASENPSDELLNDDDWGSFLCFFSGGCGSVKQYGLRIFTKGSGWNDNVTHWMPLPDAPKKNQGATK